MIYDTIIIGSGPAGLAAAIYAQRARLSTLVIEQSSESGGQVLTTYEVDNYPGLPGISGTDLSREFRAHADKLGAEFKTERVKALELGGEIKVVKTRRNTYEAKTVILATGASHAKLGVPGELEYAGMGVSYCATCDGAFFKDKDVAVVGGGDVAVEDAIFLARASKKVYVIHRRDELRAAKSLQDKLLALPNVEMVWNSNVKSMNATDTMPKHICSVTTVDKFSNEERTIPVDGIFVAVGIIPVDALIKGQVEQDAKGYVVAGETCETSIPGVFAAGDIRTKALRQIVTAAADGANAVTSVERYLNSL